jgi:DNA-binding MarR family transcriptional regulator
LIGNLVPLLRGLSGNTQDLFWYLAESMDKENNIRMTQKKLSKSMNIAQPHISKVLKELEYHGLILRGYGLYKKTYNFIHITV